MGILKKTAISVKAMSHPLRLKTLCTLADAELAVHDIVEAVGTTQSNVSQHLAKLRDKQILTCRRDANKIYYRVSDQPTLKRVSMMCDLFCSKQAEQR